MFLSPWSIGSPVAFLKSAVIEADGQGIPSVPELLISQARSNAQMRRDTDPAAGTAVLSIAIRDAMFRHYFHFMETLLILFATQQEYFPNAQIDRIFFGAFDWNNPSHADVQRHLLAILYPEAQIITSLAPEPITVENLIYVNRRLLRTRINKMIDPLLFLVAKWGPALRAKVYAALGIELRDAPSIGLARRSLYVSRKPPRTLAPDVEATVMNLLSANTDVSSVDFSGMSWADQVRVSAQSDLMLGVHGNGLTNLLWLSPHAMVIEIFPEGVHHYDYQILSEIMQLNYFGLEGDRVFRPFTRCGAPYGHNAEVNKPVERFRSDALQLALSVDALQMRAAGRTGRIKIAKKANLLKRAARKSAED
jgi:Glycosyltransferase 61